MKCTTVRTKLAGYLDDAITGSASVAERVQIGEHLNGCTVCRGELERFRKLSVLLSRMPKNVPPADLAVRIKVAAAQSQHSQDWSEPFPQNARPCRNSSRQRFPPAHRSRHRWNLFRRCDFRPRSCN